MKKLIFIFLVLFSTLSQAKVWEVTPGLHWDAYWDQKFQNWIKDDVDGEYFKKLGNGFEMLHRILRYIEDIKRSTKIQILHKILHRMVYSIYF